MSKRAAFALFCLGWSWGCGGAPEPPPSEVGSGAPIGPYFSRSCARIHPGRGPSREGEVRQGSSVALGRNGHGLVAYVADHDRSRVLVVDLSAKKVEAAVSVFGAPEQVLVMADGRVVVSIGNGHHIEAFEPTGVGPAPLERLCARELPAGPFGLASSPDDRSLVVTSAWEPALSLFDNDLTPKSATPLARAPRGVLVDGHNRAFVTHLVGGTLSLVDLDDPTRVARSISLALRAGSPIGPEADIAVTRKGTQAYSLASVAIRPSATSSMGERKEPVVQTMPHATPPATRNKTTNKKPEAPPKPPPEVLAAVPAVPSEPRARIIVPMVSVDPGDTTRPSESYYGPPPVAGVPKQAPVAVVVDPIGEVSLTSRVVATTGELRGGECVLPRAMATHPSEELLYVACLGLDQVLELDARSADPMRTVRRRFPAPKGPTGIAIAEKENIAVVFGQFDDSLALIPLQGGPATNIDLASGPIPVDSIVLDPATMRGRELFYRSDNRKITSDGLACSSCHPDGTEDGLTWFTPEGPRQTPMLSGRLVGTQPYGWTRHQEKLETYISDTCQRLGGTGLDDSELNDLASYISSLPAPPRNTLGKGSLVAAGRHTFDERGCSECHVAGVGTDGKSHAFASVGEHSSPDSGIDTPSLRDVGLTAPYFHDGRYSTLDELLSDKKSNMGTTASLTADERDALKAFLGSL